MDEISNIHADEWRQFIEMSYDGIIIANHQGRIVYMNPASERLEEVSKEYILGKHAGNLVKEGIYERSVTVKVFETQDTYSITQYKGGKLLVITGTPLFENGKIKWVYINERDVTELNKIKTTNEKVLKEAAYYKKQLEKLQTSYSKTWDLIAESSSMKRVMDILQRVAPSDVTILLEGESGTGKDIHANWIHKNSLRNQKAFVKIDCGSLPKTLLESELFGYEKGAFTGANKEGKKGLAEMADEGTLFLDEIGEFPLDLQPKLLRLLQDQTFLPVGGVQEKKVDIRIIAATNQNLEDMVKNRTFREDLFYRLNVVPIKLPPLRERSGDLVKFIDYYLNIYNKKYGFKRKISKEGLAVLCKYNWPGNVRELTNIIERLVVITPNLEISLNDILSVIPDIVTSQSGIDMSSGYKNALENFEKIYFESLIKNGNTISQLAKSINISESTLKRKLRKYNLSNKMIHPTKGHNSGCD